jgi:hypothetical protein
MKAKYYYLKEVNSQKIDKLSKKNWKVSLTRLNNIYKKGKIFLNKINL